MKAIGLIRVSTRVQELESQSIKVKEAILKDGYREEDIILIEDKESGSKLSEEEMLGLNKLKQFINTEQVSSVYCYEISRISRKASVVFSIRDYLICRKIQLVVLNPYFRLLREDGTLSPESNIFFGIFSSMAENETMIRTARIMRGKEKKKSEGKLSCGIAKIGYTVDENHFIIPHPVFAPVIQEIFERYTSMESSGSIAKDLFLRSALPIKTNKLISYQSIICAILKDGRYAKIDPKSIYPPIISKELYYRAVDISSNKPAHFVRKSNTKTVYPLQGVIYNEEGYKLVPSISNNRYLKMRCNGTTTPISLNMSAAHELSKRIIEKYLSSGVVEADREKRRIELSLQLERNRIKLEGIDPKIAELQRENDFIQSRIIKGRLSESKGDSMIDENTLSIHSLEDTRQEIIYQNSIINNKLVSLSNPFVFDVEKVEINSSEELKELVTKYIDKVIVHKIEFARYRLEYFFKDSVKIVGEFYSVWSGVEYKVL